jgi:hypothetical protein
VVAFWTWHTRFDCMNFDGFCTCFSCTGYAYVFREYHECCSHCVVFVVASLFIFIFFLSYRVSDCLFPSVRYESRYECIPLHYTTCPDIVYISPTTSRPRFCVVNVLFLSSPSARSSHFYLCSCYYPFFYSSGEWLALLTIRI